MVSEDDMHKKPNGVHPQVSQFFASTCKNNISRHRRSIGIPWKTLANRKYVGAKLEFPVKSVALFLAHQLDLLISRSFNIIIMLFSSLLFHPKATSKSIH